MPLNLNFEGLPDDKPVEQDGATADFLVDVPIWCKFAV